MPGSADKIISRLIPVPLRELWKHEARDFSTWLAGNLDFLGEVIGMSLSLVEQESAAGAFSVDIVAEDAGGNLVIIENQLEKTDHDHLGKLVTYMSNLNAKTAIWITSQPRPEHERAVQWLNEILPADTAFYLIKLEAYRIANSPPAPLLTVVAGPSEESRKIGSHRKDLAERNARHREFWQGLIEKLQGRTRLHANLSPSMQHWLSAGAGKSGLGFNYVILKDGWRVELYIDTPDQETNKRYFDYFYEHKEEIEKSFGESLRWNRKDNRRASSIEYVARGKQGLKDRDAWPRIQESMIDAMSRLHKALSPYIKKL